MLEYKKKVLWHNHNQEQIHPQAPNSNFYQVTHSFIAPITAEQIIF